MRKFIVILMALVSLSLYGQDRVHVGDILCTDNTVISHDAFASSGRTALGIVFFVDNTQQHGWALALTDAGSGAMAWGNINSLCYLNGYNNIPQAAVRDTSGAARCDSIVHTAQIIGWTLSEYSAAVNAAMQCGEGWYLPSIGQLAIMYANMPEINAAIDAISASTRMTGRQYWSCTEENSGTIGAWIQNFDGAAFASPKGTMANVRAIRNF